MINPENRKNSLRKKRKNDRTTACLGCGDDGRLDALGTGGDEGSADAG